MFSYRNLLSRAPLFLLLVAAVLLGGVCSVADNSGAEQIHLSFTDDVTTIQVTYSTFQPVKASARYGTDQPDTLVEGVSTPFAQDDNGTHLQYINRVSLTGLLPGERHVYQVLGPAGWSEVFWFRPMQEGSDWSPRLAVYGDLGMVNGVALPFIVNDTYDEMYDAVLHVGDFGYDMYDQEGEVGDTFMRQIQPVAAHLPYMTCPGNHEQYGNFSNYKNRFSMPGGTESMYYSFDMGPVHFISISTEFYYFTGYGTGQAFSQYNWLVSDLEAASEPSARAARPWIVLYGHRPMYCTNRDGDDCTKVHDRVRVGAPDLEPPIPGLEDLLMQYGVDLAVWGHEHSYERMWPLYNYRIYNGTDDNPYRNPGAPVHIVTGSAGCQENLSPFSIKMPWTAFRSLEYGYSRFTFHNATHMSIEQVETTQEGATAVIDEVTVVRESHGPYELLKKTERGYL
ncbi:Acid phosphatase type 7 [Amphibalanus amphitrite]|uniref:Purple acid phosphatase n=1 Tax=Amphibalanus amphitrite TaxID=1232801 RepID=A0A6A4XHU3_AMPAM|nr:Acid phosphatase type 7 [Amphibalanus amphitrite]